MSDKKQPKRLNESDINVIRVLTEDAYASDEEIADRVHLAKSTVEGILQQLRAAGYVTDRQRRADLVRTGAMLRYRIDIKINPSVLQKNKDQGKFHAAGVKHDTSNPQQRLAFYIRDVVAMEFKDRGIIIEEISILLGDPADLCVTLLVPNLTVIFDFVTEKVRGLEEIENTSTSQVAWRIFGDPGLENNR